MCGRRRSRSGLGSMHRVERRLLFLVVEEDRRVLLLLVQEGIRIRRRIMGEVRVRERLRDDRPRVMVVVEWLGWGVWLGCRIVAMVRVLDQEGRMEVPLLGMVEVLLRKGLMGLQVMVVVEVPRPEILIGFRVTVMVALGGLIGVRDLVMAEVLVRERRVVVRPMAMVKVEVPVEVGTSLRIMVKAALLGHRVRDLLRLMALAVGAVLVGAQVMAVEDPIRHHVSIAVWLRLHRAPPLEIHDSSGALCKRSKTTSNSFQLLKHSTTSFPLF